MKRLAGVGLFVAGAAAMLSLGTASADAPLHSTSSTLVCQAVVLYDQSDTCTVQVADTNSGSPTTPTGTVEFSTVTSGTFANPATCTLSALGSCQFTYPGWDVLGTRTLTATYDGDPIHARSSGTAEILVTAPIGGGPPCHVPNVKGKRLAAARTALRRSLCRVGAIDRAFSRRVKKGRVISEKPRHGKYLRLFAKVALVVSKGKRQARP
jgi:Big-like domain-containing protein/PASTA domain-containing protein